MEKIENEEMLDLKEPEIPEEADKSFKTLFVDSEKEARETNREIEKILYNNFYIEDLKKALLEKYGKNFFEYTYLNNLIGHLNAIDSPVTNKMDILADMEEIPIVDTIYKYGDCDYVIKTIDNQKISFSSISGFLRDKIEKIEGNEYLEHYINSVESLKERESGCHGLSIYLSKILHNYINMPNNLITGYPSYYIDKNKYLHSWIELNVDGELKVMDSTNNVVMNKDAYYKIKNIKEQEILSIISSENIVSDDKKYGDIIDKIDLKTYLTARDEIIENINKVENKLDNKVSMNKTKDDGEER